MSLLRLRKTRCGPYETEAMLFLPKGAKSQHGVSVMIRLTPYAVVLHLKGRHQKRELTYEQLWDLAEQVQARPPAAPPNDTPSLFPAAHAPITDLPPELVE